jgi:hypothetical protein
MVETVGEAWQLGWRVTARCDFGKHDGMRSIRECVYAAELDMRTLVFTRGLSFPLSDLASRLKCPACGSRHIRLIYTVPKVPTEAAMAARSRW